MKLMLVPSPYEIVLPLMIIYDDHRVLLVSHTKVASFSMLAGE